MPLSSGACPMPKVLHVRSTTAVHLSFWNLGQLGTLLSRWECLHAPRAMCGMPFMGDKGSAHDQLYLMAQLPVTCVLSAQWHSCPCHGIAHRYIHIQMSAKLAPNANLIKSCVSFAVHPGGRVGWGGLR